MLFPRQAGCGGASHASFSNVNSVFSLRRHCALLPEAKAIVPHTARRPSTVPTLRENSYCSDGRDGTRSL